MSSSRTRYGPGVRRSWSASFVRSVIRGRAESDPIDLAGQPVKIDVQAVHADHREQRPQVNAYRGPGDRGIVRLIDHDARDAQCEQQFPGPQPNPGPHTMLLVRWPLQKAGQPVVGNEFLVLPAPKVVEVET